ncbi:histidine phosphatase family protein [Blastococcus sp. TF02A-26]|uniref:histidine phosphatase family protein n=1 Tax=Blastococcus sp. TF02A-26 TaxID=2250577 RepID=UPI000DE90D3B|nr:histidine phosphatase family protein [Blastococcus sp. TF02A-26]RBY81571.1 histidine phosphatase family protein [Blastococcus sp. TF02A-26]
MATELYLVRHGEAVANIEPVIGGMRGDRGLTSRGREQCRLLEHRLSRRPMHVDRLVSSTLPRALETAEYVARALGLPVLHDEGLHELRPGEADGLTVQQWRDLYRVGEEPPGTRESYRVFSPGGESWATFLARAGGALTQLVTRHRDETVVAVCHAGIVEASFALAFGLGASAHRVDCAPTNTSLTHWRHRLGPCGEPLWTLVTFNDASHLTNSVLPESPAQDAVPLHGDDRAGTGEERASSTARP